MKNFKILLLLALINFTNILDFMVMMPLGPQLKRTFDLGPSEWSLLIASYALSAFASGVAAIFFIDKFDRKKFLLITYVFFIFGTFLCAIAKSYEALLFGRIIAGIFGGTIASIVLAIVGDTTPPEKRATAMGIVMAGFSAAAALGVPFGIYFGTLYNWHMPFYAIVVLGVITTAMIYFIIPNITSHIAIGGKISGWTNIKNSFADKNQLIALIFMVVILFGQFSIIPFLSPYMVANVGFTENDLLYIYLFGGIVSIFTSAIIGKLSDKFGKLRVFTILLFLSLIPIVIVTNLGQTPLGIVLFVTTLFFIFAGGRMIPATAIVLSTAPPQSRGAFMSIRSAVQQLGAGVAGLIAGVIVVENPDGSYSNYQYVGYIAVVMSLLSLWLIKKIVAKH
jgi:DHA1 family inner membrane transport protein